MLRRLVLVVAVVFVALNVIVAAAVRASGIDDDPVDIQTRALYELRRDQMGPASADAARAVFVGDSLIHAGHLRNTAGPGWAQATLPAQYAKEAARRSNERVLALNLGVDGVLYSDLACVVKDVLEREPEWLILDVSPRPFASDFAAADSVSERPFLCSATTNDAWAAAKERLTQLVDAAVPTRRHRDLLQLHFLDNTPRAFVVDAATRALRALQQEEFAEDDAALEDMAWRFKAAQRYNGIEVSSAHPQAEHLDMLIDAMRQQPRTQVLIFYLGENISAIAEQLEEAHYREQSRRFVELVSARVRGATNVRFVVLPAEAFRGLYTDHIHLTPEGYTRLAARLLDEASR